MLPSNKFVGVKKNKLNVIIQSLMYKSHCWWKVSRKKTAFFYLSIFGELYFKIPNFQCKPNFQIFHALGYFYFVLKNAI